MAIRRCPYCKAIIDESQKYCNNCGTQLLFPQDEEIEEDIKGEKIRDDDFRDAEPDKEEAEPPAAPSRSKDARKEIDLGKILEGEESFPDDVPEEDAEPEPETGAGDEPEGIGPDEREETAEEIATREVLEGGEALADLDAGAGEEEAIPDEMMGEEIFADEDTEAKDELENGLAEEEPPVPREEPAVAILGGSGEAGIPPAQAPTPPDGFNGDLDEEDKEIAAREDRGETPSAVDDEARDEAETREEIGRLIAALEKKHRKPAAARAAIKAASPKKETSGLPAWAEPSPTAELPLKDGHEAEAEAEEIPGGSYAPGDTMDFEEEVMRDAGRASARTTIGIPETLSKIETTGEADGGLDEYVRDDAGFEEWERAGSGTSPREDVAVAGSDEVFVPRKRLGFFGAIKAALCDIVFIAALWFVAVLLAAKILSLPVQTLISESAVPLALFFGVLLVGYLFLFLFFLGETLGARIAAKR